MAVTLLIAGCSSASTEVSGGVFERDMSSDWTQAPLEIGSVSVLAAPVATDDGPGIALHTNSGDKTFWSGVNLGSTTPGHNPGELSPTREDYRRWLGQMGDMNVHFLRIYTLLPPVFYDELLAFNQSHVSNPIYLVQGAYLPDETYVKSRDLFKKEPTRLFSEELKHLSAAVSGDLVRGTTPGRASGTWTSDVSPWLAAWIIGAELDPEAIHDSDTSNRNVKAFRGEYFTSTQQASPTESWYAARMNELAGFEVARGRSAPIAFINWPTTDPLRHPTEPSPKEDLVGVDANHIAASASYPGGTFASYHAYPYYPDFLRYTPAYREATGGGEPDAYIGYLTALKQHHAKAGLATMVTEFGVPSSIGSAHFGTAGRDQGAHSEADAMSMDASMLRSIKAAGLSGALVFSWTDEWFKRTWNTEPRQDATNTERRALWHDPLTNEQWFGIFAQDPVRTGWRTLHEGQDEIRALRVDHDAAFVYVDVDFDAAPESAFTLNFAIVGDQKPDVQVVVDPVDTTARAYVRSELDPILLDGLQAKDIPKDDLPGWRLQRLTANRSYPGHPAEFIPVGELETGNWDPADPSYNSIATWNLAGTQLELRLPWSMLLIGDPTTRTAVTAGLAGRARNAHVREIAVSLDLGAGSIPLGSINWETWNRATAVERMKAGAVQLAQALRDLN